MAIERKRGWKQATEETVGECGVDCDAAVLPVHVAISLVVEEGGKGRKKSRTVHYGVPLCDWHRRLLCTCDLCAHFYPDKHPVDEDDPEFLSDGYCQVDHEAADTDGDDWCGEWAQARPLTVAEAETKIRERLEALESEDEEVEGDEDETDSARAVGIAEIRKGLGLGE